MTEVRQQLALANAQELVSKMNDKWCVWFLSSVPSPPFLLLERRRMAD